MKTTISRRSTSIYGPLMDNGNGGDGDDPKDPNNGDTGGKSDDG